MLSGPFSLSWFLILCLPSLGYAREKLASFLKGSSKSLDTAVLAGGRRSFWTLRRPVSELSEQVL